MNRLLVFGAGYSALACARRTRARFVEAAGTTRSSGRFGELEAAGLRPLVFSGNPGGEPGGELEAEIAAATHLLVSIGPGATGDPALDVCRPALRAARRLRWICYLSTIGVYGDHGGAWIDEETACRPVSQRSRERLEAENGWRAFAASRGLPLSILRLPGIYGPGRNAFVNLREGTARRIVKPGQVFNRVHRDDIAGAFSRAADMQADGVFNIADDAPSPPQDVVAFAALLMGAAPPPEEDFATASLSPMARSFYGESKRVSNARSKRVLGLAYAYPDYRTALTRMWRENTWNAD